jgi:hypothetical protein
MAEDLEQHMTKLTWLVDELQDEIKMLDTAGMHRYIGCSRSTWPTPLFGERSCCYAQVHEQPLQELAQLLGGGSNDEQNVTNTASWR